jgi:hypothetical protein
MPPKRRRDSLARREPITPTRDELAQFVLRNAVNISVRPDGRMFTPELTPAKTLDPDRNRPGKKRRCWTYSVEVGRNIKADVTRVTYEHFWKLYQRVIAAEHEQRGSSDCAVTESDSDSTGYVSYDEEPEEDPGLAEGDMAAQGEDPADDVSDVYHADCGLRIQDGHSSSAMFRVADLMREAYVAAEQSRRRDLCSFPSGPFSGATFSVPVQHRAHDYIILADNLFRDGIGHAVERAPVPIGPDGVPRPKGNPANDLAPLFIRFLTGSWVPAVSPVLPDRVVTIEQCVNELHMAEWRDNAISGQPRLWDPRCSCCGSPFAMVTPVPHEQFCRDVWLFNTPFSNIKHLGLRRSDFGDDQFAPGARAALTNYRTTIQMYPEVQRPDVMPLHRVRHCSVDKHSEIDVHRPFISHTRRLWSQNALFYGLHCDDTDRVCGEHIVLMSRRYVTDEYMQALVMAAAAREFARQCAALAVDMQRKASECSARV